MPSLSTGQLKRLRVLSAVVAAAFLFGANGVASKELLRTGTSTLDLATIRATGAAASLWVIAAVVPGSRRRVLSLTRPEFAGVGWYSVTGFILVPLCYYVAIRLLPIAEALTIEYLAPILVALYVTVAGREPVTLRVWFAVGFGMTGISLVTGAWRLSAVDFVGVLAALGAAFSLAASFIFGKAVATNGEPLVLTVWAFSLAAVPLFAVNPIWKIEVSSYAESVRGLPRWSVLLFIVFFGSVLSYLLLIQGLRSMSATQVSLIGMLEPVFAASLAWVALGETLVVSQVIGGSLVLAGVFMAETTARDWGRGRREEARDAKRRNSSRLGSVGEDTNVDSC